MKIKLKKKDRESLVTILNLSGNILILLSVMFLFFTFGPVIAKEIKYRTEKVLNIEYVVNEEGEEKEDKKINILTPSNKDFSIIIPKIGAVAPIIEDVDPFNPDKYLPALKKGAAHAAETSKPGENGNVYVFAHSTVFFIAPYSFFLSPLFISPAGCLGCRQASKRMSCAIALPKPGINWS